VSVPAVHEYGPYTLYDLDALPEDGKRYELADGWLTELSPSPWHDQASAADAATASYCSRRASTPSRSNIWGWAFIMAQC